MQSEPGDGKSIVSKPAEPVQHDGKGSEADGTSAYLVIDNTATLLGAHQDGNIRTEAIIEERANSNATVLTEETSTHGEADPEFIPASRYLMTKDSPNSSLTSSNHVTSDLLGCTRGHSNSGEVKLSDCGDMERRVAEEYHEDCGVQSLLCLEESPKASLEESPKGKATDAFDINEVGATKSEKATASELPVNGDILPICRKDSVTSPKKDKLEDHEGVHKSVSGIQGNIYGGNPEMSGENRSAQAAQSQLERELMSDIARSSFSDCLVEEKKSQKDNDFTEERSLIASQTGNDAHSIMKTSEFGTDAHSLDEAAQIALNWNPDGEARFTATVLFPSDSSSPTQTQKAHCNAGITEISNLTQRAKGKVEDKVLDIERSKSSYANDPETHKDETFCRPELFSISTKCDYGSDENSDAAINQSAAFQPPRSSSIVVVLPGQYPTSKIQRPDKPSEPEVRKNEKCSWLKWNAGMDYDGHIVQTDKRKIRLPEYFEKTNEIDYGFYTITHSDQPNIYNVTRGRLRLLPGPSFLKSIKLHEDRRSKPLKQESDLKQPARFFTRKPKQLGANPLATTESYDVDLNNKKRFAKEGIRSASVSRLWASSLTSAQSVSQSQSCLTGTPNKTQIALHRLLAHESLHIARDRNVSRTPSSHTTQKSKRTIAVDPAPEGKFNVRQVEQEIRNIFQRTLEDRWYEPEFCQLRSTALSDLIKSRVKDLVLPSFKLISIVMMGEAKKQGLLISSLCFWNKQLDNYAEVSYCVNDLWAVGLIYAVDQF